MLAAAVEDVAAAAVEDVAAAAAPPDAVVFTLFALVALFESPALFALAIALDRALSAIHLYIQEIDQNKEEIYTDSYLIGFMYLTEFLIFLHCKCPSQTTFVQPIFVCLIGSLVIAFEGRPKHIHSVFDQDTNHVIHGTFQRIFTQ